jgi:DNA-binding LytR/AlgR family response regulator
MRIHRSYIINLNAIVEVNKNRVIVEGDVFLPIGDSYRDAFNEYIRNRFIQ